jgi:hypothetical protein
MVRPWQILRQSYHLQHVVHQHRILHGSRIGALITNLVLLLIAILLFTDDGTNNSRMSGFSRILIVLAAMLLPIAADLFRAQQQAAAPSSAVGSETVPPAPSAPTRAKGTKSRITALETERGGSFDRELSIVAELT